MLGRRHQQDGLLAANATVRDAHCNVILRCCTKRQLLFVIYHSFHAFSVYDSPTNARFLPVEYLLLQRLDATVLRPFTCSGEGGWVVGSDPYFETRVRWLPHRVVTL